MVEIQFDGFSYPALDQVVSHVAKYRERTRGRVEMPITIRIPSFGGIRGKEHHGESTETYWVHTAGLKVVVPSSALDAYRLLRLAIADPDPVIVLEPKARYWSKEEGELTVDGPGIGAGRVLRDGDACTVVTYGAMVARCLEAAGVLAGEGIAARVVDLRSLSPLDVPLLGTCARETGRVVVVHEAPMTLGMGAEIAARVMEEAFDHLEAPVARVTGLGRAVPARVARAALPAERRAHRRGRPADGEVLMAERVFAMPDLGEGLEEGEIVAWLVAAGDDVTLNQPLVEVETAKATVEIPSPFAGRIASLHGAVGDAVPVGSPLVTFALADGTTRPSLAAAPRRDAVPSEKAPATPAVRKLAKERGIDLATITGTGPGGRITVEDLNAAGGWRADVAGVEPITAVRREIAQAADRGGRDPTGDDVPDRGLHRARRVPARAGRVAAPGVRRGPGADVRRPPVDQRVVAGRRDPHGSVGPRGHRDRHRARSDGARSCRTPTRWASRGSAPRSGGWPRPRAAGI